MKKDDKVLRVYKLIQYLALYYLFLVTMVPTAREDGFNYL